MIIPDVNVLVGALRLDHPHHEALADWLAGAVAGAPGFGLTMPVLAGVVRVVTHPRIFADPTPLAAVLADLDALLAQRRVTLVRPGQRYWQIFCQLCREADAKGNLVVDAQHAAIAVEQNATWASLDHDFARFPSLDWLDPLTGAHRAGHFVGGGL